MGQYSAGPAKEARNCSFLKWNASGVEVHHGPRPVLDADEGHDATDTCHVDWQQGGDEGGAFVAGTLSTPPRGK